MSKHTSYLLAVGCSLLQGCQSSHRSTPSRGLKLPFKVEIVPKRPFEWELDISGVPDRDELLREVQQALQEQGAEADCVECEDGQLRVMGRSAFAAVAPLLSKRKLLAPLKSRMLTTTTAHLNVEQGYLPQLGVDWRFLAHTNRVRDIVQYALLTQAQADDLLDRVRRDRRGELMSIPRITLANTQRGYLVVGTSHPFVEGYEIGTDGTLTPKMGDASTGQALDLFAYVNNDGTITVNLTSWTCDPATPVVRGRKLHVGLGPNRTDLPCEESLLKPVEFHVQFVLTPDEAVLFTNGGLVRRGRHKRRDSVKLIMLRIVPVESGSSATQQAQFLKGEAPHHGGHCPSKAEPKSLHVARSLTSKERCHVTRLAAGTSVPDAIGVLKARGFVMEPEDGTQSGWLTASNLTGLQGQHHYVCLKVADGQVEKVVEFAEHP